jgi:hypothetical protein
MSDPLDTVVNLGKLAASTVQDIMIDDDDDDGKKKNDKLPTTEQTDIGISDPASPSPAPSPPPTEDNTSTITTLSMETPAPPAAPPLDLKNIRPFTNSQNPNYLIQGTLEKESVGLLTSFKRFFFRLDKENLVYYTKVEACAWGFVPIDERGSVPIRLITRLVEDPIDAKGLPKRKTEFEVYVTNAENNRYPGRNHAKKDSDYERVYKFNAMDVSVKTLWCGIIRDCLSGKFNSLADLSNRFAKKQRSLNKDNNGKFKTNLARLCRGGDDWDDVPLMAEQDMLKAKEAELKAIYEGKIKKYVVKKAKNLPLKVKIAENVHLPNDMNAMNDRRHMTVAEQPMGEEPEAPGVGKGGCGCVIA